MESPTNTKSLAEVPFGTPSSHALEKQGIVVTPGVTPGGVACESDDSTAIARNNGIEPHENDVLCGRGGSINSHPGNERFRELVERRKRVYLTARFKREKRLIANSIVSEIRALNPSGRFLTRDSKTGFWCDIGDEKARDKTSQALRENAPSIRAEIEVEINHQRAEIKRAEEEEEAAQVVQHYGPPPPQYYPQPWGYYPAYPSYGHYPPPAGHEPHRGYTHPCPSDHHSPSPHYQRSFSYDDSSNASGTPDKRPSTASVTSRRGGSQGHYNGRSPRNARESDVSHHSHNPLSRSNSHHSDGHNSKSAFSEIPKFVTSVPSSIAAWTKTSFSFGGNTSGSSDANDRPVRPHAKPLAYVHQHHNVHPDCRDGPRRSVTFEEHRRRAARQKAHPYARPISDRFGNYAFPTNESRLRPEHQGSATHTPIRHSNSNTNSITPDTDAKMNAIEPHGSTNAFHPAGEHPSLLSQFAANFLGSWDGMGVCANSTDGHHDGMILPHRGSADTFQPQVTEVRREEAYGATEESQEVELLEMMDCDDDDRIMDIDDEERTPPPAPQRHIQIDWPSKMLGCQSQWLPDTFDPPSIFTHRNEEVNSLVHSASLEMEHSAIGMEGFSTNGSLGGGSLCRVFTQDQIDAYAAYAERPLSPVGSFNHHALDPIPSWERSFRSGSSVGTDDASISSRISEKGPFYPISPRLHQGSDSERPWRV
jgi:hypothetical protein